MTCVQLRSADQVIIFSQPALLLALPASLLPLLIHLLLRARPRRVRFPALALLQPALREGRRASRVRRWWLLIIRMLAFAALCLLLAGPRCADAPIRSGEPLARVILLDESGSMQYRMDAEQTVGSEARRRAARLLSGGNWPAGSEAGIVSTSGGRAEPLSSERIRLARTLDRPAVASSAAPLGEALRAAAAMLREARQPQREIVIFTDGAAHAWSDVSPAAMTGLANVRVRVEVCQASEPSNIGIQLAAPPTGVIAESAPARLSAVLRSQHFSGRTALLAERNGRLLAREALQDAPADGLQASLTIPALGAGLHGLTLRIEPTDRFDLDQTHYLALETGPRPRVWLIEPRGQRDLTRLIFANLLAPAALPEERQRVELRSIAPERISDGLADSAQRPDFAVLFADVDLDAAIAETLLRWVTGGGTLLLVPISDTSAPTWAGIERSFFSGPARVEALSNPATLQWQPHATYTPPEDDELPLAAVRRVVRGGAPLAGTIEEARFTSGSPAILSRQVGNGRVMLLMTSPDPAWSDLGIRAAGLLVWLHHLANTGRGPAGRTAQFTLGAAPRAAFVGLPQSGSVRVERAASAPETVEIRSSAPEPAWPASVPGLYRVLEAGGTNELALYAVNWPPSESDLTQVTRERAIELLGTPEVEFEGAARAAPSTTRLPDWLRAPRPLLGIAILLLVLTEMMMTLRNPGIWGSAERPG